MAIVKNLKHSGEHCKYPDNKISRNQNLVISIIKTEFKVEFSGHTFGEAWNFISTYEGKEYYDGKGNLKKFDIEAEIRNFKNEKELVVEQEDSDYIFYNDCCEFNKSLYGKFNESREIDYAVDNVDDEDEADEEFLKY